jgi:ATP-dependent Lon protease
MGKPATLPTDLPDLPRELSFWIGSHLGGPVADQQQALLEITDTHERLQQEFELLDETRRQLAARTVLQDTFRDLQDPADADLSDQDNDQGDFDEQER